MAEFNFPSSGMMKIPEPVEEKPKEPAQVKAVAKAKIKKTKWQEFMSEFFEEDITNVKDYIVRKVLIKGAKDLLFECIRVFFYPNGRTGRGSSARKSSWTSYDSFYEDDRPIKSANKPQKVTYTSFNTEALCYDTPQEAQDVLDQMVDYQIKYGQVTVARCYDFSGLTPPHTANRYGWESLSGAEVIVTPEGYGLRLPRPKPL